MNSEMVPKDKPPYINAIAKAQENFAKAAETVSFEVERIFAAQALMKTDFAMQTANKNPQSVHLAMLNVAATGLTLNPAYGYAYLVPRDGAIVLDISYKGLLKIATDTGAIRWGRADVVYANDVFMYRGPAEMPQHTAEAFTDRGHIVGVYCIAKTSDGDILCDIMDMSELEKIRGKSDLYAKRKSGPWVEWFTEMACKAIIKRAQKTWPHTERSDRLLHAIDLANASEGGYTLEAQAVTLIDEAQGAIIREWIETAQMPTQDVAALLALYDVETIEALPKLRYNEVIATLKARANENP